MKPKVFISSTYHDLIPYRHKLWDILSDLDINILGMEKFGARSDTPLDTCLKEVEKSHVYIGIIAYKYGSIEPNSQKSFTELEYEKALELNKEILIYLFDDNGLIQPKFIDLGEKSDKLIAFKDSLKNNHTVDFFKEPTELSEKVYNSLGEILPRIPKKFFRPKRIKAKINHFLIDETEWIAFVGYLYNSPIEIFTGIADDEILPIPKSVKNGYIIEEKIKGKIRYDFFYIDKFGYENTLGGINHKFNNQMSIYNQIITKLLRKKTPLDSIFAAIDDMDIPDIKNSEDYKKGVKESLSK